MFVSSMLVAVLAAISSVQAIPTPQPSVTVTQSIVTTSSVSVTTSQAATITSQAFATTPRSSNTTASVTTPGPGPIVSNAAAIASGLNSEPSVDHRLKKLLYDNNGTLLTGESSANSPYSISTTRRPPPGPRGALSSSPPSITSPSSRSSVSPAPFPLSSHADLTSRTRTPARASSSLSWRGLLYAGFVQENGFNTKIETQLGTYQGTAFPMGSIHYQQNPTCSPAVFVAALNNEDPGRSDITKY